MPGGSLTHSGQYGYVDDVVIIFVQQCLSAGIGIRTTDFGSYLEFGVDLADTLEIQIDEEVYIASKDGVELAGSQSALGKTSGARTKLIGEVRSRGFEALLKNKYGRISEMLVHI